MEREYLKVSDVVDQLNMLPDRHRDLQMQVAQFDHVDELSADLWTDEQAAEIRAAIARARIVVVRAAVRRDADERGRAAFVELSAEAWPLEGMAREYGVSAHDVRVEVHRLLEQVYAGHVELRRP